MKTYKVELLRAREHNAIGMFYPITVMIDAHSKDKAINEALKLYESAGGIIVKFLEQTIGYEFNDITEIDPYEWRDDVAEYRYLGHTILETAKRFDMHPNVVRQFDELDKSDD